MLPAECELGRRAASRSAGDEARRIYCCYTRLGSVPFLQTRIYYSYSTILSKAHTAIIHDYTVPRLQTDGGHFAPECLSHNTSAEVKRDLV